MCGHSIHQDPREIRRLVGYMPDFFGVYDDMKVIEYLEFFAAAYRIQGAARRKVCEKRSVALRSPEPLKVVIHLGSSERGQDRRFALIQKNGRNRDAPRILWICQRDERAGINDEPHCLARHASKNGSASARWSSCSCSRPFFISSSNQSLKSCGSSKCGMAPDGVSFQRSNIA